VHTGNMEDALKHISYQTFIKHRQDLSKQGGAPDTEHAAAQAAMRDADGNMIVAAYKVGGVHSWQHELRL